MSHVIGKRRYASETYPTPTHASSSPGSSAPLSNAFYVDPHSTDAGPADGSDEHPFKTIQEGFDAVFAGVLGNELTFLVTPCFFGDNAGPLVIPDNLANLFMSIVGLAGSNRAILTSSESAGIGAQPTVGAITGAGGNTQNVSISFENISVDSIDLEEEGVSGGRLSLANAQVGQISCNVYELLSVGSTMGETQAATIEAYSSSGQDCTWTANEIRLDPATNFQCAQNNVTLAPGFPIVMSKLSTSTISVAVPLLATDALGYANVSTTGTELAGIDVDDVVVGNPTADLAAAGAGNGGFLNCRVSAPDTIRCAFGGALPGGASDFIFTKVS